MKKLNSHIQQHSKRAVTVFGLALLLSSGQALAGKPQNIAPSDGNPFVLTYNCVSDDFGLPLVSDPIPEGYYLAVEHIYGQLIVKDSQIPPEWVTIFSYGDGLASSIVLLPVQANATTSLVNESTSISFTQTPPSVLADGYVGHLSQSPFCNINFHGKLVSY